MWAMTPMLRTRGRSKEVDLAMSAPAGFGVLAPLGLPALCMVSGPGGLRAWLAPTKYVRGAHVLWVHAAVSAAAMVTAKPSFLSRWTSRSLRRSVSVGR